MDTLEQAVKERVEDESGIGDHLRYMHEHPQLHRQDCLLEWIHRHGVHSILSVDSMRKLPLHQRAISELPSDFHRLLGLEELYLYHNALKRLPRGFGGLSKLRVLNLDSNRLVSLPESVGELKSLQVLRVGKNKLTKIPPVIGKLEKLRVLRLPMNNLASVPDEITKLKHLEELNLYRNSLTSLPEALGELVSLKYLDIDLNQLRSMPCGVRWLRNLERFFKNENPWDESELDLKEIDSHNPRKFFETSDLEGRRTIFEFFSSLSLMVMVVVVGRRIFKQWRMPT
mmetsp:Transcript_34619/g.83768  ORF Transcript_34619/g.83768 Transcript_34619/m.83768 type:complete len:285 (+) Transcript_34619:101-955(+)